MEPTERNRPLKACPDMSCRRNRTCHSLARGKACLITHFRNDDEWLDYMAAKINRITRRYGTKPSDDAEMSEDEALSAMYEIFQERAREFDQQERDDA
jgi:hypothetical protein